MLSADPEAAVGATEFTTLLRRLFHVGFDVVKKYENVFSYRFYCFDLSYVFCE